MQYIPSCTYIGLGPSRTQRCIMRRRTAVLPEPTKTMNTCRISPAGKMDTDAPQANEANGVLKKWYSPDYPTSESCVLITILPVGPTLVNF
jgi:hypothetical protein